MHELDLIPASYRQRLQIQRWCSIFVLVLAAIVLAIGALKYLLAQQYGTLQSEIRGLQKEQQISILQQRQYNALLATEKKLHNRLEILEGLRGGPSIRQIFLVIDRVIDADVWFQRWTFSREGKITPVKPKTVQTGYFIIIEDSAGGNRERQAWQFRTHMEIQGQARNHTLFAAFVKRLLAQPEIEDVQVLQTKLHSFQDVQVVDFKIAVIVDNRFRGGYV